MSLKDWIGFEGDELPGWKSKATAWFNDVAVRVRTSLWENAGGTLRFFRREDSNGRMEERYELTSGSPNIEKVINDARVELESENNLVSYMNNSGTEITRIDRATGYIQHSRILSGTVSFYSGWSDLGGSYGPYYLRKDPSGVVHIGLVASNTSGGNKTNPSDLITLPVGFRPSKRVIITTLTSAGIAHLYVYTNGLVQTQAGPTIPNGGFVPVTFSFFAGY